MTNNANAAAAGMLASQINGNPHLGFTNIVNGMNPLMQQRWSDVRQLEGGILGYFEEVGGDHWNGDCFVFDRRVALDPALEETTTQMCWACREPLTEEEMESEQYVLTKSCPYCIEKN